MKFVLGGMLGLLVLVGVYIFSISGQPTYLNYPPQGTRIIAFGDSLTWGMGAEGNGFVEQISSRLGIPIENAGVPGDTTRDAIRRVERDVLGKQPNIVIVEFGGNDRLQKFPSEETFANLRLLIQKIQSSGAFVILVGVRGALLSGGWGDEFESLAEETGVLYIPDILDGLFGNSKFMADAIHPNAEGYSRIADRITPILAGVIADIRN